MITIFLNDDSEQDFKLKSQDLEIDIVRKYQLEYCDAKEGNLRIEDSRISLKDINNIQYFKNHEIHDPESHKTQKYAEVLELLFEIENFQNKPNQ